MIAELNKLKRNAILAVRGLLLQKMRAFLSVLGIIIGTAAVIALMAFGNGSMKEALDAIKSQGATNIVARSVKPPEESGTGRRSFVANYGLTDSDLQQFKTIGDISRFVPMRVFSIEVREDEKFMSQCRLVATTAGYAQVHRFKMASGRFLIEEDSTTVRNVCVLGNKVANELYPFSDPLGKTVRFKGYDYRVIGVMAPRTPTGGTGGSQAAEEYDSDVYIPLETCNKWIGQVIITRSSGSRGGEKIEYNQITMTVDSNVDTPEGRAKVKSTGELIRDILTKNHRTTDWAVTVPLDQLEQAEATQENFTRLLVLIASISLLVGGIGIMNIMLATVTERTREIGIRRALGAKRRDIVLQFLVEAVVQTALGGLCGVLLGLGIVYGLPWIVSNTHDIKLPAQLSTGPIYLSLGVSIAVGVLFGLYPAVRAARLDPIEALRHE
ncbi:MAG: ABC transporter permease [Zavarzinella sp.]